MTNDAAPWARRWQLIVGARAVLSREPQSTIVVLQDYNDKTWRVTFEAQPDQSRRKQSEYLFLPADGETLEELVDRVEAVRLQDPVAAAKAAARAQQRAVHAAQREEAEGTRAAARIQEAEEAASINAPRCAANLLAAAPSFPMLLQGGLPQINPADLVTALADPSAPHLVEQLSSATVQRPVNAFLSAARPLPPWALDTMTSGDVIESVLRHCFTARKCLIIPFVCKAWRLEWHNLLNECRMPRSQGERQLPGTHRYSNPFLSLPDGGVAFSDTWGEHEEQTAISILSPQGQLQSPAFVIDRDADYTLLATDGDAIYTYTRAMTEDLDDWHRVCKHRYSDFQLLGDVSLSTDQGEFHVMSGPKGMAAGAGRIFITEDDNHCVAVVQSDDMTLHPDFLGNTWGAGFLRGLSADIRCKIADIAVHDDTVIIAGVDGTIPCVRVCSLDGELLRTIGGFACPSRLAIGFGRLFVSNEWPERLADDYGNIVSWEEMKARGRIHALELPTLEPGWLDEILAAAAPCIPCRDIFVHGNDLCMRRGPKWSKSISTYRMA